MRIPVIQGVIDRRILVNYRVDPDVMAAQLPAPFRPSLVRGHAIGGICLIRLKHIRPKFIPPPIGIGSENAAHRIAVEWDHDGQSGHGVYIPRRDTSSRFNTLVGGRLFPGVHHHARFTVDETKERLSVSLQSDDGRVHLAVTGSPASRMPETSTFETIQEASAFFERGALGYSVTHTPGRFDGLELNCRQWKVTPLHVESVASSYFENPEQFPPGSVEFDCALLMQGIDHEWRGREDLCCESQVESS